MSLDLLLPSPGGASAFVDLTDAPETIVANRPVMGNSAGNALVMTPGESQAVALIGGDGSSYGGSAGLYAGDSTGNSDGATVECGGGEPTGAAGIGLNTGRGLGAGIKGGDVLVTFGESGAGAADARLLIEKTTGNFADANNGQVVTYDPTIGPGGAAISIKRWIPVTVDGVAGWIPHFGV